MQIIIGLIPSDVLQSKELSEVPRGQSISSYILVNYEQEHTLYIHIAPLFSSNNFDWSVYQESRCKDKEL